jgi:adenine/guanine phosphoribosyltransferase-like PRPP-binding protein
MATVQQQAAVTDPTPEQRQKIISDSIRGIPDFPKPGILFWDVTTLMLNPTAFKLTIDALYDRYKDQKVDVVAGVCDRRQQSVRLARCITTGVCNVQVVTHCTTLLLRAAGFEARGLIFGAPLALALGCAFVPLRKPGKLPGGLVISSRVMPLKAQWADVWRALCRWGPFALRQHDTSTQWPCAKGCTSCANMHAAPLLLCLCPAGETISESYITEYSTDKIEMHTGAVQPGQKVVLVSA